MKIAYWVHLNMGPKTGVFKKVIKQAQSWNELGEQARLYVLTRDEEINRALYGQASCFVYGQTPWWDRLKTMRSAVDEIIRWDPDIVYMRQDHFYPAYRRLGRAVPVVAEINSNVGAELKKYSKLQWLYNELTERRFWRSCKGAISVTNELTIQKERILLGLPVRVIGNSVGLEERAGLGATMPDRPPTLAFVGSSRMIWHGVDKVYRLARHFPAWRFHLVGSNMQMDGSAPENTVLHGTLPEEEYVRLLADSDVAISTLALHRNGMNEASPLKTREYLAYGLPVIIGYKDTDFPDDPDFLLRLENREDNVERSIDRIRDFVLRWKGRRVPREQVLRIDAVGKEKARIAFFKTVLGQS